MSLLLLGQRACRGRLAASRLAPRHFSGQPAALDAEQRGVLERVSRLLDRADSDGMAAMADEVQDAELPVLLWFAANLARPRADSTEGRRLIELNDVFGQAVAADLVSRVPLKRGSRVLELGFGGGNAIVAMAKRCKAEGALVVGVDSSRACCEATLAALDAAGCRDHAELRLGSVSDFFPFDDGVFDAVYHLNCWYFWSDLHFSVAELCRVLKPRGLALSGTKLALIHALFRGRFPEVSAAFKHVDLAEYAAALAAANMRGVSALELHPLGDAEPLRSYTLTLAQKPRSWAFKPVLGPANDCRALLEPGSWPPFPAEMPPPTGG
jgi:SAM-dependent methyltransferase